jgi:gamma-glutamyltranspeptidase
VPACDGWNELLTKHGTRRWRRRLEPAISTRATATRSAKIIADQWKDVENCSRAINAAKTFLIRRQGARARRRRSRTRAGRLARADRQGRTRRFYKGAIAKAIADDMASATG